MLPKGKKDVRAGFIPIQNSGLSTSFPSQGKGPGNEVAGLSVTVTNWFI